MEFHLGQRVTRMDSDKRGTVVEIIPGSTDEGPWVRVEPDYPDETWTSSDWEDRETIRPLNSLERMSEL